MILGKTNIGKGVLKGFIALGLLLVLSSVLSLVLLANKSEESTFSKNDIVGINNSDNFDALDISKEFLYQENGESSWYGPRFHNRKTASGEVYNMHSYSAAHKTLPFGTILKVTNTKNNVSTFARVNDRGPFVKGRILDLSFTSKNDIDPNGNPDVKIESLMPKNDEIFEHSKIEYYFGYSLTNPLVCLPMSNFKTIEVLNDFDLAVDQYKNLSQKNIDKNVYIIVPANEKNPSRFIIAYIDSSNDDPINSEFANN